MSVLNDPAAALRNSAQQKKMFELAGLRMQEGQWLDACDVKVQPEMESVDLNADGRAEVFVTIPGNCSGGAAGASLSLFTQDACGSWQMQFSFPAGGYRRIARKSGEFPDLELIGPGICSPVWRWSGTQYRLHKQCDIHP